jgi:hypothetical protein
VHTKEKKIIGMDFQIITGFERYRELLSVYLLIISGTCLYAFCSITPLLGSFIVLIYELCIAVITTYIHYKHKNSRDCDHIPDSIRPMWIWVIWIIYVMITRNLKIFDSDILEYFNILMIIGVLLFTYTKWNIDTKEITILLFAISALIITISGINRSSYELNVYIMSLKVTIFFVVYSLDNSTRNEDILSIANVSSIKRKELIFSFQQKAIRSSWVLFAPVSIIEIGLVQIVYMFITIITVTNKNEKGDTIENITEHTGDIENQVEIIPVSDNFKKQQKKKHKKEKQETKARKQSINCISIVDIIQTINSWESTVEKNE